MAETKLNFKLSSHFEGEGFRAATQAIVQNRQEIKSSIRGLGELGDAFGAIDPKIGAAVGSVKSFAAAFATGGIVGGAITLALRGLSEAIELVGEKLKETKELAKSFASAARDVMMKAVKDSADSFNEMRSKIAEANSEAKDLIDVMNGAAANEASNKIFEINTQRLQDLADAMSENEKQVINAAADYKIALVKAKEKETEATNAVESYTKALDSIKSLREQAANRIAAADENYELISVQCTEYIKKRGGIENDLANGFIDSVTAQKKLTELEEKYKDQVAEIAAATQAQKEAKEAAASVERDFTKAQNKLTLAEMKLEQATHDAALAEKEGAAKLKEARDKEADAALALADKEAKAAFEWETFLEGSLEKLNDATGGLGGKFNVTSTEMNKYLGELEGLSGSIGKTKEELDDFNLDDLDGGKHKNPREVKLMNTEETKQGLATNVGIEDNRKEINKPKGLDDATFARLKNGTASVADWKRFDRFHAREERDAESSKLRIGADAVKFISNANKAKTWLSEHDINFQNTFKERVLPQMSKEVAAKLLKVEGKRVLNREDMNDFLGDNCAIINFLKGLGLQ